MRDLNICLVQFPIAWLDPERNRRQLEQLLQPITSAIDLIVLPEMFTTGFTMEPAAVFEEQSDRSPTLHWMQSIASQKNAAVTGSVVIRQQGSFYNRLYFITPDGAYYSYDKRHLFRMADEHRHYQPGTQKQIILFRGWRICPLICYDLRFPVWSRNRDDYDLLIYIANWPATRAGHWQTLLKARAIENLCYVAGVNRIGVDGNHIAYQGDSLMIDAAGRTLANLHQDTVCKVLSLNYQDLCSYRDAFPAFKDVDDFTLHN